MRDGSGRGGDVGRKFKVWSLKFKVKEKRPSWFESSSERIIFTSTLGIGDGVFLTAGVKDDPQSLLPALHTLATFVNKQDFNPQ